MIKIGEFSKLVQVPVPALRYYDQVGLRKFNTRLKRLLTATGRYIDPAASIVLD